MTSNRLRILAATLILAALVALGVRLFPLYLQNRQFQQYVEQIAQTAEAPTRSEELLRVANLPYKPDLNDGVLINAAPLWKLFRLPKWRKDLEACWKELESGDYDWSHMAYTIWPGRVREKCRSDRSIAIAHGLEELCPAQAPKATKARRKKNAESTQMEI